MAAHSAESRNGDKPKSNVRSLSPSKSKKSVLPAKLSRAAQPGDVWITPREAAQRTERSLRTIQRWAKDGIMVGKIIGGKLVLINWTAFCDAG